MNGIGILKDVAYASKRGGGTVAAGEWGLLAPGALAVYGPTSGVLLAANVANAAVALGDSKNVRIAVGLTKGVAIFDVPRQIDNLNYVVGRSFVAPIITIGGTTAAKALAFENTGDVNVKVMDTTYSSLNTNAINASVYKTVGMTAEQTVDAVVAKLNAATNFGGVTATKVVSGSYLGITITPVDKEVQIDVALDGMWAGSSIEQTTPPVYGIGLGTQIAQIEKDCNAEIGDGGYIEYSDAFFSKALETVLATTYDVFTATYRQSHQGAVTSRNVSLNVLQLALPKGAAVLTVAIVSALLNAVFVNPTNATSGVEIGVGDGTDDDGVSGN